MNGTITSLLNAVVGKTSAQNRFTQTSANLAVNGFLFDVKFTVPENYTGKWDFLKDYFINITKRIGSGNGGAVALLSNVSLYDILSYSDFIAGVSMVSTSFQSGEEVRVSGYADTGYFAMTSRDALEVTLNIGDKTNMPNTEVVVETSAVFEKVQATEYKCYSSLKATGADQPYKNVLSVFYIGDGVNADVVVTDEIGVKAVNINSAIAMSNAEGRFEFFTKFGEVYKDQFGLSQDISMRVPNTANPSVLVVTYAFYPEETVNSLDDSIAQRNALIEKIKNNEPDKYLYLKTIGAID